MRRQCQATEQGAPVPEIVSSDASALPRLKAGITTTLFLFLLGCSSLFELSLIHISEPTRPY